MQRNPLLHPRWLKIFFTLNCRLLQKFPSFFVRYMDFTMEILDLQDDNPKIFSIFVFSTFCPNFFRHFSIPLLCLPVFVPRKQTSVYKKGRLTRNFPFSFWKSHTEICVSLSSFYMKLIFRSNHLCCSFGPFWHKALSCPPAAALLRTLTLSALRVRCPSYSSKIAS